MGEGEPGADGGPGHPGRPAGVQRSRRGDPTGDAELNAPFKLVKLTCKRFIIRLSSFEESVRIPGLFHQVSDSPAGAFRCPEAAGN